ncbi:hypothetical protein R1flu_012514 [Riccia fluitans]|uniref:Uncharacterized protein n=1 Tax=Riccia fluitans TaxID=41844 RepID=A0ABD1ZEY0_9MARC
MDSASSKGAGQSDGLAISDYVAGHVRVQPRGSRTQPFVTRWGSMMEAYSVSASIRRRALLLRYRLPKLSQIRHVLPRWKQAMRDAKDYVRALDSRWVPSGLRLPLGFTVQRLPLKVRPLSVLARRIAQRGDRSSLLKAPSPLWTLNTAGHGFARGKGTQEVRNEQENSRWGVADLRKGRLKFD